MGASKNPRRPNVLLLFCDQLRRDALGVYGNRHVHTPNLDRLASQGVVFERTYTPVPVCIAARYCLLTGHRPRVHQYWDNMTHSMDPAIPTLPRIVRDGGYVTQAIGKMHFQPMRSHHGFDRMWLMEETPRRREDDDYLLYLREKGYGDVCHQHGVRHLLYMQPQRSLLPEEHTGNHWVAERTIDFLKANAGREFFCWSSWIAPHPPFNTVDKWAEFYDAENVPPPLTHRDEVLSDHALAMHYLADMDGGDEERRLRRVRRAKACYYAQVSHVDEQVGRVLSALDELGLSDNTLVFFTSDHGEMLGDHGAWQKSSPYEGAWGVPLILRWPDVIGRGERTSAFASLLDVLPTCLDACGLTYPAFGVALPGHSLLDVDVLERRDVVFAEEFNDERRWCVLRTDRYKLAHWVHDGRQEFFDLKRDPEEFHNLAIRGMDAEQAEAYRQLRGRLLAFERENGPWPVSFEMPRLNIPVLFPRVRNAQFPSWTRNLTDPAEIKALNDLDVEVLSAIEKEPDVRLSDLDLDSWVACGGSSRLRGQARKTGAH